MSMDLESVDYDSKGTKLSMNLFSTIWVHILIQRWFRKGSQSCLKRDRGLGILLAGPYTFYI